MTGGKWKPRGFIGTVLTLALLIMFLPPETLAYETPPVGRLSEVVDDTFILGKDDVDWSYAEPELILEEGDLLQTNETGRTEIQLDRTLIFRIGERTRIAVIELNGQKVVGMDNGRAYLRVARELSPGEAFILSFPSGQLTALGAGLTRIDVKEDGSAEVKVVRGSIELETTSGRAESVRAGEQALINAQGSMDLTGLTLARRDDFDAWNEALDIALSTYPRPRYLEHDIVGQENLEGYGDWIYREEYDSYAWRPYVVDDWRPYYHGRWYYSDYNGWTWIPEEPWGYVTYHYGSWNYDPYYGWIWVPGYVWRPAHVHWVVYGDYIGWVPLGYHGYPVITTYPYYVSSGYVSHFDFFSFTFVFAHDFHHYHHYHHHDHHGHHDHDDHNGHHDDHKYRRASHEDGKHRDDSLKYDKEYEKIPLDGKRRVAQDFLKADRGAKARLVKNLEKEDLKRTLYKGIRSRDKVDYEKILNVDKHPGLRKKIEKLDKGRRVSEQLRAATRSGNLPKKVEKDKVKALDFRRNTKQASKIKSERNATAGAVRWADKVHEIKRDNEKAVRVPNGETAKERSRFKISQVDRKHTRQATTEMDPERRATERQSKREITRQAEMKPRKAERVRAPSLETPRRAIRETADKREKRTSPELNRNTVPSYDYSRNTLKSRARQSSVREPEKQVRANREIPRVTRGADVQRETPSMASRRSTRQIERTPRVQREPVTSPPRVARSSAPRAVDRGVSHQPAPSHRAEKSFTPSARHDVGAPTGKTSFNSLKGTAIRSRSSGRQFNSSARFGGHRK